MVGSKQPVTAKRWIKPAGCILLILAGSFLLLRIQLLNQGLYSQQAADRWSGNKERYAQVTAFFSNDSLIDVNEINTYRSAIQKNLEEESIQSKESGGDARLWVDAYSGEGPGMASRNKNSAEIKLIGVGGEFFLFHPLTMLSGSCFSQEELMKDRVVIDETLAWKLFGSYDAAGMDITIGNKRCLIAGVYRAEKGKLEEKAYGEIPQVFGPIELLTEVVEGAKLSSYEIVLPNPVSDFARQIVLKHVAGVDLSAAADTEINLEDLDIQVIENTSRYSLPSLLLIVKNGKVRSMSTKPFVYPYWENTARAYEDLFSQLLLGAVLCYITPLACICIYLVKRWKKRKWTLKRVKALIEEKVEERKKKRWEEMKNEEKF